MAVVSQDRFTVHVAEMLATVLNILALLVFWNISNAFNSYRTFVFSLGFDIYSQCIYILKELLGRLYTTRLQHVRNTLVSEF